MSEPCIALHFFWEAKYPSPVSSIPEKFVVCHLDRSFAMYAQTLSRS
ncbi:MAG: hypothetical protein H6Q14_2395 [Bacteroidetes bacterium]|jgi:hypothetical protein|nr:hypothetical protein [Bacteroidota bacterium]